MLCAVCAGCIREWLHDHFSYRDSFTDYSYDKTLNSAYDAFLPLIALLSPLFIIMLSIWLGGVLILFYGLLIPVYCVHRLMSALIGVIFGFGIVYPYTGERVLDTKPMKQVNGITLATIAGAMEADGTLYNEGHLARFKISFNRVTSQQYCYNMQQAIQQLVPNINKDRVHVYSSSSEHQLTLAINDQKAITLLFNSINPWIVSDYRQAQMQRVFNIAGIQVNATKAPLHITYLSGFLAGDGHLRLKSTVYLPHCVITGARVRCINDNYINYINKYISIQVDESTDDKGKVTYRFTIRDESLSLQLTKQVVIMTQAAEHLCFSAVIHSCIIIIRQHYNMTQGKVYPSDIRQVMYNLCYCFCMSRWVCFVKKCHYYPEPKSYASRKTYDRVLIHSIYQQLHSFLSLYLVYGHDDTLLIQQLKLFVEKHQHFKYLRSGTLSHSHGSGDNK